MLPLRLQRCGAGFAAYLTTVLWGMLQALPGGEVGCISWPKCTHPCSAMAASPDQRSCIGPRGLMGDSSRPSKWDGWTTGRQIKIITMENSLEWLRNQIFKKCSWGKIHLRKRTESKLRLYSRSKKLLNGLYMWRTAFGKVSFRCWICIILSEDFQSSLLALLLEGCWYSLYDLCSSKVQDYFNKIPDWYM